MQCIGIHTTTEHFARSWRNSVVSTSQTGDRIEEDNHIMTTFHHTLCLFQNNTCNLHVAFSWFVKCRSNHFCLDTSCHVCHFFRTFVDEQHNHVCFRMIGCNGIGDILHQDSLTSFRLSYNQSTLSFTDRREKVYYTSRQLVAAISLAELELLIREKRSQMVEWYTVTHQCRFQSIDFGNLYQWEIFFAFLWWTDWSFYHITGLQSE